MQKIEIYDTTLRDGSQSEGISYSAVDKLKITEKLDDLGVHYIEGGWPGSNPKDKAYFKGVGKLKLKNSIVIAFGSTRRANKKPQDDENVKLLLKADTKVVTIFGKSWDFHVKKVFKVSLDENLKMIYDTINYLKKNGVQVIFDAEHFFDGFKANPQYALKTLKVAEDGGAETLVLCDTNGGTLSMELARIVAYTLPKVGVNLGIHTHNDSGLAVANSIIAVESGATQVQGTMNGYGERCGNADLCSIIPALKLKLGLDCINAHNLAKLTEVSHFVSEISNLRHRNNAPYVGSSAFAHKAGVHVNAMVKNPLTYEHADPGLVGNHRRFLISELSGRTSITVKAKELKLDISSKTPHAKKVLKLIQDLEHQGYQFEAADGSFQLLLRKALKKHKKFFDLKGFRLTIEKQENGEVISEASIKLKVKGVTEHTASAGDGPVNALDNALRKALINFYPTLADMHLTDFKVRVLDEKEGTAARVRVLIQSQDDKDSWGTVGVSENVIEASYQALTDSVRYKLLKDKVK